MAPLTTRATATRDALLEDDGADGNGTATITMRGPAGVWFAIAFGAFNMADSPYAIVADGGGGGAFEQKIGTCGSEAEHCPGDALDSSALSVVSDDTVDGARTLVLARPLAPLTAAHYDFRGAARAAGTIPRAAHRARR